MAKKTTSKDDYSKDKYRKLIVWDASMKDSLEVAAKRSGLTITGFIKKCVADELKDMKII